MTTENPGTCNDTDNQILRLKVIKPIYEELCIGGNLEQYPDLTQPLTSSDDVYQLFGWVRKETREHFIAIHLDSKNKILAIDRVSTGSLNASIVHPRDLFKSCLLSSCAALILVHNHPSGNPDPSQEDKKLTQRLKKCADLLGIRLLDHLIIGKSSYTSLTDQGQL